MKISQLKTTAIALAGVLVLCSCGPVVQLFNVEMRVPATHPLDLAQKNIAVFSKISSDIDSLMIVNLASSFSAAIEKELSYKDGSVPVFNIHSNSADVMDNDYINALSQ